MARSALTVICGLLFIATPASAQGPANTDEKSLFERVFGTQAETPTEIKVDLSVNARTLGQIDARISLDQTRVDLDATGLRRLLSSHVTKSALDTVFEHVDREGRISIDAIRQAGLDAKYDPGEIAIRLDIPAALRPLSRLSLRGGRPDIGDRQVAPPARVSAALNLRAGLDYVHRSNLATEEGRQPARIDLEWAANVDGTVLLLDGFYFEDERREFQRGDALIVHDWPSRAVRASVGDVSYPVQGMQSFRKLGGFAIARNYDLQPYRVTAPSGRNEFILQSESRVEVVINGQVVRVLRLAPGPYDIRDFPFTFGANDVELRIIDNVGRREVIRTSTFFDSNLLGAGVDEFAVGAGFPAFTQDGLVKYDRRRFSVSGFYRRGLTDTLTVGANLQGDWKTRQTGIEAVWASPVGTIGADVSLSGVHKVGADYAARVTYRYSNSLFNAPGSQTIFAAWESMGPRFAALGDDRPQNSVAHDLTGTYSRVLTDAISAGLSGRYQIVRNSRANSYSAGLFFRYRLPLGFDIDFDLDFRRSEMGTISRRGFITLSWVPRGADYTARMTRDTERRLTQLTAQFQPGLRVGEPSVDLTVQRSGDTHNVAGSVGYRGNRFEATAIHDVITPRDDGAASEARSSLRFASAIVFADGHVAPARPVNDAFVMVTPHPLFSNQRLGVGPLQQGYDSALDWMGPIVLPEMTSYRLRSLVVDAADLPIGYELGEDTFFVEPGFRQGTVIDVGEGVSVFLGGSLVDALGSPLALQVGTLVPRDAPDGEPVVFFTNRRGRFRVDGLSAGTVYEINLETPDASPTTVEVPSDAVGLYDAGAIVVDVPRRGRGAKP